MSFLEPVSQSSSKNKWWACKECCAVTLHPALDLSSVPCWSLGRGLPAPFGFCWGSPRTMLLSEGRATNSWELQYHQVSISDQRPGIDRLSAEQQAVLAANPGVPAAIWVTAQVQLPLIEISAPCSLCKGTSWCCSHHAGWLGWALLPWVSFLLPSWIQGSVLEPVAVRPGVGALVV